jgi:DNA helicase II / ATP-dependent DNA helicase PcrA
MPSSNTVILASAGSGKTTFLVDQALSEPGKKVAILSYTNNNVNEIKKTFLEKHGGTPRNVDTFTWFNFELHECARPYQRSVYSKRVRTISFPKGRSSKYVPHSDTEKYYFVNGDEIYSDKLSQFIIECEEQSGALMTRRLAEIYDEIYIDEFQDLAGYDLELIEVFLRAGIQMTLVGDPRQCTYTTNNSLKNSQYRGIGILDLVLKWEASNLCAIDTHARSHRCSQQICDFADALWPGMAKTTSLNQTTTEHDGMFLVSGRNLHEYVKTFNPAILRYSISTNSYGYSALNFGNSKGLGFQRVLIFPHGPIKKYLRSGNLNDVKGSIEKFYVAVTRARQSVAFLLDDECTVGCFRWEP